MTTMADNVRTAATSRIAGVSSPNMTLLRMLLALAMAFVCAAPAAAQKIEKRTALSEGEGRTYYLFVPDTAKDKPAPLIVMLHGSGRDGRILVEHWQSLAKKEGIILAGPDATKREGWSMTNDGPVLLRDVV